MAPFSSLRISISTFRGLIAGAPVAAASVDRSARSAWARRICNANNDTSASRWASRTVRLERKLARHLIKIFFSPHSAAIEPDLIARAKGSWWWNEAPSRFDIPGTRAGAQKAREARCTGFLPSLECYSYVQTHEEFGEPWLNGRRQVPFGFGRLAEGASPYRELPMRAARLAYREFIANPTFPTMLCTPRWAANSSARIGGPLRSKTPSNFVACSARNGTGLCPLR